MTGMSPVSYTANRTDSIDPFDTALQAGPSTRTDSNIQAINNKLHRLKWDHFWSKEIPKHCLKEYYKPDKNNEIYTQEEIENEMLVVFQSITPEAIPPVTKKTVDMLIAKVFCAVNEELQALKDDLESRASRNKTVQQLWDYDNESTLWRDRRLSRREVLKKRYSVLDNRINQTAQMIRAMHPHVSESYIPSFAYRENGRWITDRPKHKTVDRLKYALDDLQPKLPGPIKRNRFKRAFSLCINDPLNASNSVLPSEHSHIQLSRLSPVSIINTYMPDNRQK